MSKEHRTLSQMEGPFPWEQTESFPESTEFSLPMVTRKQDAVYIASFLYQNQEEEQTLPRPFAWFLKPLETSFPYSFNWCQLQDFADPAQHPFSLRVSAKTSSGDLFSAQPLSYQEELEQLFKGVLDFVFVESLSSSQQETLSRYRDLFLQLCPTGYYPFYQALAPDFLQWAGLTLLPNAPLFPERSPTEEILHQLKELSLEVQTKLSQDQTRDIAFDTLHRELQSYKAGEYNKLTLGMERDVILLIDQLEKSIQHFTITPPTPARYKSLLEYLGTLRQDLADLLYRQGVDPYVVEGEDVEIPKQKVLETIPTPHQELDKKIAEKLTQGWEKAGNVVRPEYVRVYVYEPSPAEETKELLEDE